MSDNDTSNVVSLRPADRLGEYVTINHAESGGYVIQIFAAGLPPIIAGMPETYRDAVDIARHKAALLGVVVSDYTHAAMRGSVLGGEDDGGDAA